MSWSDDKNIHAIVVCVRGQRVVVIESARKDARDAVLAQHARCELGR